MILFNDQFFESSSVSTADHLSILRTNDIIFFTENKQSWDFAITNFIEYDFKGIVLELGTVFLGHLESEGDYKLWSFDIFIGDFEGNHLKGKKGWIYDL